MSGDWTRHDIIRRYRWRLVLYWLGLIGVACGAVMFFLFLARGEAEFASSLALALVVGSGLLMIPASACLNCGRRFRHMFGVRGIRCVGCGAVHFDPWRRTSGSMAVEVPGRQAEFPASMRYCWLHPPIVERYPWRARLVKLAMLLGGLAGIAFLLLMATIAGAVSPPIRIEALAWTASIALAVALALYFTLARCPHCRKPLDTLKANALATWCGRCGAVLRVSAHGKAAFEAAGRVVDEPPERRV